MGTMDKMDKMMAMMMLREILREDGGMKVSPFTVSIEVTPVSISAHMSGNKAMIKDLGAEEWLRETEEKIRPIMTEQTTKFAQIFSDKFGCEMSDGTDKATDILKELLGGQRVGE